jgi:hypothetical protein
MHDPQRSPRKPTSTSSVAMGRVNGCRCPVDQRAMTESSARHRQPNRVRLVVADVDGTLVTPDKIVTPRARAAVRQIREADIAFTITSGRPPRE